MLRLLISKTKRNKRGFTLIELIVVIAIIAIVAAIGIPMITGQISKANQSTADSNARIIANQGQLVFTKAEIKGNISLSPAGNAIAAGTFDQTSIIGQEIIKEAGVKIGTGDTCSIVIVEMNEGGVTIGYSINSVTYTTKGKTATFTRV